MITVKVSSGSNEYKSILLRQTPGNSGIWKDCQFIVNEKVEKCDWWVVLHVSGLKEIEKTKCNPDNIVYLSMEPNEKLLSVNPRFLSQFSTLMICDRDIRHKNSIFGNALTWWVGIRVQNSRHGHRISTDYMLDYDVLSSMQPPVKTKLISLIISNKKILPGHKKRLEFIDAIMSSPLKEYIDIFGDGYRPVIDKWDALLSYKYHLVLENTVIPDYWSEKIGDAFLGFCYPIYYGCPNIHSYFSGNSLSSIDIEEPEIAINRIMEIINSDIYSLANDNIIESRILILNKYNIFNQISEICNSKNKIFKNVKLYPNWYFRLPFLKRYIKYALLKLNFI
jgi:hypothetical protein